MFLDAGAEEIALIAAVALIVVGPKDLPPLLRKVGQFTAKMRGLAAEFRSSFDELARQSELDELRKEVNALRNGQYIAPVAGEIDGHFEALHREFGAPPPPALTHEGTVLPGPEAAAALETPAPADATPLAPMAPPPVAQTPIAKGHAPEGLAAMAAPSILPPVHTGSPPPRETLHAPQESGG
jgi:sec-independent protein translocase protein TatB